ncbi:uncharacterized protein LOC142586107 [Dermacentor variabilis]|uniref:uncharacterized protein LOC142586107 n=1 Tax=Dermacentor variabilis TaxID=34621 RepID=UPI003F5B29A1
MTRCFWTEVSRIVTPDSTVADDIITALQKRWKSLPDQFRRLLKTLQEEKSGAGADDVQNDVIRPFFGQTMFLRDTMEYRLTPGSVPPVPPSSEEENAADILTKMRQFSNLTALEAPSPSAGHTRKQRYCLRRRTSLQNHRTFWNILIHCCLKKCCTLQRLPKHTTAGRNHKHRWLQQTELGRLGSVASEATTSRGGKRKKKDEGQIILQELGNVNTG